MRVVILLAGLLVLVGGPFVSAQEFRVFTRILDERAAGLPDGATGRSPNSGKPVVVSRSLTLFHAGKVYDYLESLGEVIIFEPSHEIVTVLSPTRLLQTVIPFGEIGEFTQQSRLQAERYIAMAKRSTEANHSRVAQAMTFQLKPQFTLKPIAQQQRLAFESKTLSYTVQYALDIPKERTAAYLSYADWMAKLNFMLHPETNLPFARMQVNATLLDRNWLPTEIALAAEGKPQFRAVHQFQWNLDAQDRRLIRTWETQLTGTEVRKVPFAEFQRAVQEREVTRR